MRKIYKIVINNKTRYSNDCDYARKLLERNKITYEEYINHKLYVLNECTGVYDLSTDVWGCDDED